LAHRLVASRARKATLTPAFPVDSTILAPAEADIGDLDGARVDARDSFEWHVLAGAELNIRRAWAVFFDMRWVDASKEVAIGFNNGTDLGIPVPNFTDFIDSPRGQQDYGPVQITSGGLIDGGQVVVRPAPGEPGNTDCVRFPNRCVSVFDPTIRDGELDTGFYYVQGGHVSWDGWTMQLGVRFTFH
jgi:hypothetical protein